MAGLRIALQMDPFAALGIADDTTRAMMQGAWRRGYAMFVYEPRALVYDSATNILSARGHNVIGWPDMAAWPTLGPAREANLQEHDVLLLRQNPPFDMGYITSLYLLELIASRLLIVNHPRGVLDAPEKILIAHAPELMPPTLIAGDAGAIRDFRARHGALVLKPLYGFGGQGVMRLDDDNATAIEDFLAAQSGLPCIAQQFISAIAAGDKRVLLLDGAIAGAFRRVPAPGDFRANIGVGGRAEACELNEAERRAIAQLAPLLQARGILFAGVDLIDGLVGEINATSPGGFTFANRLGDLQGATRLEEKFWDMVLRVMARA